MKTRALILAQHPYSQGGDWWPRQDWWGFWLILGILLGFGLAHITKRGGG